MFSQSASFRPRQLDPDWALEGMWVHSSSSLQYMHVPLLSEAHSHIPNIAHARAPLVPGEDAASDLGRSAALGRAAQPDEYQKGVLDLRLQDTWLRHDLPWPCSVLRPTSGV